MLACTQGRGSGRRPRGALLDGEAVHLVAVHAQAARAGQALVAVRALEVLGLLMLDQRRLVRKLAVAVEAPGLDVLLFLLFPHHCARRSQTDGQRRLTYAMAGHHKSLRKGARTVAKTVALMGGLSSPKVMLSTTQAVDIK